MLSISLARAKKKKSSCFLESKTIKELNEAARTGVDGDGECRQVVVVMEERGKRAKRGTG